MTSLRLHHLLGMVLLLLVPVVTQADTGPITGHLEDPVFLSLPNKTTLDNKTPLDLYFSIDKEACRKQYGDRYYSGCRRNLKLAGKTVRRGISITPQISGEWRWENDYHLRFTPHEPWLADQEYKAVFDKSAFPVHVSLNKDTYTFRSRRFQIRVPEMKFFQDPDNPARKVVATRMTFNYPVDKSTLEPRTAFSFHPRDDNKSLPTEDRFPFEITYNPQGTEANLITPLSLLPDKEKFLQLVVDAGVQPRGQTRPLKLRGAVGSLMITRAMTATARTASRTGSATASTPTTSIAGLASQRIAASGTRSRIRKMLRASSANRISMPVPETPARTTNAGACSALNQPGHLVLDELAAHGYDPSLHEDGVGAWA